MLLIAAAHLFMAQAAAPVTPPDPEAGRYQACIAQVENAPDTAYEEAMAWIAENDAILAHRCAAAALVERGRPAVAAARMEELANRGGIRDPGVRAELYAVAGNAWLAARNPGRARTALTETLTLLRDSPEYLPDVLIDRAQALGLLGDWRAAEEDLNRALDLQPDNALALRLRSGARVQLGVVDLALADAERAAALAPTDIETLLALGAAREAKRLRVGR